jgi:hypothetical protein
MSSGLPAAFTPASILAVDQAVSANPVQASAYAFSAECTQVETAGL